MMKRIRSAFLLVLLVFVFGTMALGSGESTEAKKVGEAETEASSVSSDDAKEAEVSEESKENTKADSNNSEIKAEYHVGESLSYKGLEVSFVESGYYTSDNDFIQPKDGNQYIRLQVHVDNKSGSDKSVSVYDFYCYADGYECEKSYFDDDLSASLSDGRSADGAVYFEIPQDAKDIEIEYEYDLFADKKAKIIFEGDKSSGMSFETNTSQSEDTYHVGDIIETKDVLITYLKAAEYESDNSFMTPKDGYRYVYIELEVENTSDSDQSVSYFSFNCYADGQSCDGFYGMEDGLSTTLSPGRKAKGTIAFEVPIDAQTIEIEYEDNVWTQNKLIFLYED